MKKSSLEAAVVIGAVLGGACGESKTDLPVLSAELPLHLEDRLDAARIEGSAIPDELPEAMEWRFDRPQTDWKPAKPILETWQIVEPDYVEDALRIPLNEAHLSPSGHLGGDLYVKLPDLKVENWSYVEVRARTSDRARYVGLSFNLDEDDPAFENGMPFFSGGDRARLVTDGATHTYRLSLSSPRMRRWDGPWTHLSVWVSSEQGEESAVDILSIRVVPAEAEFMSERVGVRSVGRNSSSDEVSASPHRRSLFMHAPGRITYRVRVPEGGRLDFGLGVLRQDAPVTFTVTAETPGGGEQVFEERYSDAEHWGQRSVDLSRLVGEAVDLTLGVASERSGTVALWSVPVVSGARVTEKPNVVLYVIDGGGADYMSVYGYERPTTPNLERIAAEGALFERAHSNSSWTRPSTASFLTSLHHSVLGGLDRQGFNPVPEDVLTMAQHMRATGYLTAGLTANPNAGRMSNLDRGVDYFREAGVRPNSVSSVELHRNFWSWRAAYPAEPYWVHFQPTDVHNDHTPVDPFAGTFISPERRKTADERLERVNDVPETDEVGVIEAVDQIGVGQVEYWTDQWDLHDETMLHQDHQLGELVKRLKENGEWERTLLVIAGDHSVAAGSWDYCLLSRDPQPPHVYHDDHGTPMLRSGVSRVPLIIVWPGRIAPGQRFSQPVSMIDVLPTVLDLAGLRTTALMQGQSLAPLLLNEEGWELRPVVFDEAELDVDRGVTTGRIEVIDGRWGASLEIEPPDQDPERRAAPLLLFDLEQDPLCLESLHAEHPDLVERYTRFLRAKWEEHRELSRRFAGSGDTTLSSEQLEALEDLGYVGDN